MPIRPLSALVLACALVAAATPAPAAPPRPTPILRLLNPTVEAGEDLTWRVPFNIVNPLEVGLYPDSLTLVIEDTGEGQTRAPRLTHTDLTFMLRVVPALSAGDSMYLQYDANAVAERGRLTLTLLAHDAAGGHHSFTSSIAVTPGPGFAAHPSRMLTVAGRAVETVFVPAADAVGDAPGVLLVHGHGNHARLMLPLAHTLAGRGFAVMLVSLPGYGLSAGPADFGGPATVAALGAAFDALAREPGVDRTRLGAWGLSRGAGPALALAARRADLRAVVVQSGVYDLWAVHRGTALAGFPEAIVAEAGRDSAGWRARSPLLEAAKVQAPVLVLHGEKDPNVPAAQAHALVAALEAAGHGVESFFAPTGGHVLPAGVAQRRALDFLTQRLAAR